MYIENIHLYNMRNDEHFQFQTEFRALVYKYDAAKLNIAAQFQTYLPLFDREDTALKKIMKSAVTAEIQAADKERDTIFRGMTDAQKAALKHFNPQIQAAAKRLQPVFDTYGNLAKKPLNEETSGIYNFLQELNGTYAADTKMAGIDLWAAELGRLNNAFSVLMRGRFDETALRTDIVLKEARREVDNTYRTIVERINALVIVEGEAAYIEFIRTLNAVIAKYATIMAQRTNKSNKGIQQGD